MNTIELGAENTVILNPEQAATWWEYFCPKCRHLRLSAAAEPPVRCSNCGHEGIDLARPGMLPACTVALRVNGRPAQ